MDHKTISIAQRSLFTMGRLTVGLACLILIYLLAGCAATRYEKSTIHPHCEAKPFQECSVDLGAYKSVQRRLGGQDPTVALAAAISGGGHRAANFAAGVLLELEGSTNYNLTRTNILSEIDYFSTASGGGFTTAAYISSLHDYLHFKGTYEGYSFAASLRYPLENYPPVKCPRSDLSTTNQVTDPCIKRHLQGFYPDILSEVLKDLLSWLIPGLFNKTGYFERAIDDSILGYEWRKRKLRSLGGDKKYSPSLTLDDVFVRKYDCEREVLLPYWVANATAYENGAIFPFAPDHLKSYQICGYRYRSKKHKHVQPNQDYDKFIWNMPLSVGLTASANFPVATRPTTLWNRMDPNNRYLHLFDGGVAENLGVMTALRLLDNESNDTVTTKALIVIDAYQGTYAPFSCTKRPPPIGNTAARTMSIYLDSWRGRYREIVCGLCRDKGISVVFFSFDDVAGLADCEPLLEFGLDPNDVRSLKAEAGANLTPFELLRGIPTIKFKKKGKLSLSEQNLLLAAGRYVAHQKRQDIRKILNK